MQGPEASSHAHEAGYDAYMTGAAFACLTRQYEAAGSQPGQTQSLAQQQPNLDAVRHLMGRMNIGRWQRTIITLTFLCFLLVTFF